MKPSSSVASRSSAFLPIVLLALAHGVACSSAPSAPAAKTPAAPQSEQAAAVAPVAEAPDPASAHVATYHRYKDDDAYANEALHAAYEAAVAKRAAGATDVVEWWKNTVAAFERVRALAPATQGRSQVLGTEEAAMAGEAAYALIDGQLVASFDYETGNQRYRGQILEVLRSFRESAKAAKAWYDELGRLGDDYAAHEWTVAATARQGSLYDSLRTALYELEEPELALFSEAQDSTLRAAEKSGRAELRLQAEAARSFAREAWVRLRDREMAVADSLLVERYVTAVQLAEKHQVTHPAAMRARKRLVELEGVIGPEAITEATRAVSGFEYEPGMFQRSYGGGS